MPYDIIPQTIHAPRLLLCEIADMDRVMGRIASLAGLLDQRLARAAASRETTIPTGELEHWLRLLRHAGDPGEGIPGSKIDLP